MRMAMIPMIVATTPCPTSPTRPIGSFQSRAFVTTASPPTRASTMENVYLHRRALKPASGETTEITDRGRPVAMLMPHPDVGRLERVRLNGDLDPTTANLHDLPYPPRSTSPVAPTEVLTAMRSTER